MPDLLSPADQPSRRIPGEQGHLVDCDCIQFYQPLGLGNIFTNKMCVEVLQIREADPLRDISVIPDIPFLIRVAVAPFFYDTSPSSLRSESARRLTGSRLGKDPYANFRTGKCVAQNPRGVLRVGHRKSENIISFSKFFRTTF